MALKNDESKERKKERMKILRNQLKQKWKMKNQNQRQTVGKPNETLQSNNSLRKAQRINIYLSGGNEYFQNKSQMMRKVKWGIEIACTVIRP